MHRNELEGALEGEEKTLCHVGREIGTLGGG